MTPHGLLTNRQDIEKLQKHCHKCSDLMFECYTRSLFGVTERMGWRCLPCNVYYPAKESEKRRK